jgi:hypothetical protein
MKNYPPLFLHHAQNRLVLSVIDELIIKLITTQEQTEVNHSVFVKTKSVCIIPYTNSYSHSIALKSSFSWFDPIQIFFLSRSCTKCLANPKCILSNMKHNFYSLYNIILSINYFIPHSVVSLFSDTPHHSAK